MSAVSGTKSNEINTLLCLRLYDHQMPSAITPVEYDALQKAYDHFNAVLFGAAIEIYSEFEFAPERAQGLVPPVEQTDIISSSSSVGVIHDPVLAIVGWRPRPHELTPPLATTAAPRSSPPGLALGRDSLDDIIPS